MRRPRICTALVCLALAAPAQARQDEEPTGLRIAPRYRGELIYDDNVFLEDRRGEDDFALRFQPGVEARWSRSRWRVGTDVDLDARFYLEEEDLNEVFWNARAFLEYEPREDLRLRISDRYAPQALQLGAPEDTVVNQEQSNWVDAELLWQRELRARTELEVGLRGTRFDTRSLDVVADADGDGVVEGESADLDYWDARGWAEARYELGREREVFARLSAARRTFPSFESADFMEYFGTLGTRSQLTPRIRLELGLGWGVLDFDDQGSESRFVAELGLTYQMPRDWRLRVAGGRALSSDVAGTDFAETNARLELRKALGRRTTVIATAFWSDFDNNAVDQVQNEVVAGELRLERQITPRVRADLSYRRWKNMGDFESDDFTQNRVILGLVFTY